jgi:hypothetical protein
MQAYYNQYVFDYSVTGVQLTVVGALMYVTLNLVSPMCHVLKSYFGPKIIIIAGTVIMSLGLILAGFSTKVSIRGHGSAGTTYGKVQAGMVANSFTAMVRFGTCI